MPTSKRSMLHERSLSSYWLALRAEELENVKYMMEIAVRSTGRIRELALENAKICGRIAIKYKEHVK